MGKPNLGITSITPDDAARFEHFLTKYQNRQPRTLGQYLYYLKKIPQNLLDGVSSAEDVKTIKETVGKLMDYFYANSKEGSQFNFIKNIRIVSNATRLYIKAYDNTACADYFHLITKNIVGSKGSRSKSKKIKWVKKGVVEKLLENSKYTLKQTPTKQKIGIRKYKHVRPPYDADMYYWLIRLLSTSGLRIAEALQVRFNDLFIDTDDDTKEEFFKIRLLGIGKGGKTSQRRLSKTVFEGLLEFKDKYNTDTSELIFNVELKYSEYKKKLAGVTLGGEASSSLYILSRKISQVRWEFNKIGIIASHYDKKNTFTPHMLRHTTGMLLYKSGMKLDEVQKILDHACLDTTQIYASAEDRAIDRKFEESFK